MAAPSSIPRPLSVSYTPVCPNLLHKQPRLIPSCLSIPELCEVSNDFISEDCPLKKLPVGRQPLQQPFVCQERCVSPLFAHVRLHCPTVVVQHEKKRKIFFLASLAPLMCHGRAGAFCSHFPSFSPSSPLLSEVSSLYWMVQKQNHKPISVTLAMRLDGPNLSPSGAIGSTPVSLKRPLSSRQRGSFLFGDNCN